MEFKYVFEKNLTQSSTFYEEKMEMSWKYRVLRYCIPLVLPTPFLAIIRFSENSKQINGSYMLIVLSLLCIVLIWVALYKSEKESIRATAIEGRLHIRYRKICSPEIDISDIELLNIHSIDLYDGNDFSIPLFKYDEEKEDWVLTSFGHFVQERMDEVSDEMPSGERSITTFPK